MKDKVVVLEGMGEKLKLDGKGEGEEVLNGCMNERLGGRMNRCRCRLVVLVCMLMVGGERMGRL